MDKMSFLGGMAFTTVLTTLLWSLARSIQAGIPWVVISNLILVVALVYFMKRTNVSIDLGVK